MALFGVSVARGLEALDERMSGILKLTVCASLQDSRAPPTLKRPSQMRMPHPLTRRTNRQPLR